VYYYVTEEEDEKRHQQEVQTIKQKKRDAFTANMPRWENDLLGLPEPFQKRIQRFVDRNPDWCWEFGPYEMFCCREAVKIINRIKTIEALQVFVAAKYDEQKQIIPELEYNEHSGNTFGASVHLAAVYLNDPAMIPLAHGALCPLVGCQSYGCYAAECEPEREMQ
jgi:hypothetical protein